MLPAIRKIRNWPSFMYHYALGLNPRRAYRFRNGAQLLIGRGIDHVPIIEIFLRKDYGVVPDGAVVLDLGANIGAFTIYATATARGVRVYAYEPLPGFCKMLQENVRLNGQNESVHIFNCAVAAAEGERELGWGGDAFFFPTLLPSASGENRENILVRTTTLAQILESNHLVRVDFLKMDCEGAEYEILYGTPSSILRRISQIRMEYHNLDTGERNAHRLEQFLARNGYAVTRIRSTSESNGTLWAQREEAT